VASKIQLDTDGIMSSNVEALRSALESIELHGDGEHKATVQDLARISVALTTACAEVRQQAKARKRELAAYTDDELTDYIRGLPERRREAIITAAQGASLAGKPLFG